MEDSREENEEPRRKPSVLSYDYASKDSAKWRPWAGLLDPFHIPPPSEQAFSEALNQLKVGNLKQRKILLQRLRNIAERYWELRRRADRPPLKYYRGKRKVLRDKLSDVLQHIQANSAALIGINLQMRLNENQPLMGTPGSFEEQLQRIIRILERDLRLREKASRPRKYFVEVAVRQAVKLWEEVNGKSMGRSYDTAADCIGPFSSSKKSLFYPGPLFVQTVLQGIDPRLDVKAIRTALRHVLGDSDADSHNRNLLRGVWFV